MSFIFDLKEIIFQKIIFFGRLEKFENDNYENVHKVSVSKIEEIIAKLENEIIK